MATPIYLFMGMLDSGKTTFVRKMLDSSSDDMRILLLQCEEGDEEYPEYAQEKIVRILFESEEEFEKEKLIELEEQYHPKQVFIEYNGMWEMNWLYNLEVRLPDTWYLFQKICIIDGTTFPLYIQNMPKQMMEKIIEANMVMFNRCTLKRMDELRMQNLRIANRRAKIYMQDMEGNIENYKMEIAPMYDLHQREIVVEDADYPLWYVEVMDNLDIYIGKVITFTGLVHRTLNDRHSHNAMVGHWVMTCCENDMSYFGIACDSTLLSDCEEEDCVQITGILKKAYHECYGEAGPVLELYSVKKC